MSFRINPFNKFHPKKSAISKTSEREFEREIRKLEVLEENTKKMYKDMKRCTESQAGAGTARLLIKTQSKAESDIIQNLQSGALYREDQQLKEIVDQWSLTTKKLDLLMEELNATSNKAVTEPMKKFATIFPAVQQEIKKREQILQEYNKCCDKMEKYSKRERTGQNVVKLELSRQAYATAKLAYESQNEALMGDVPKLYEGRITYFQPSLQALIKAQMKYYSDAHTLYSDLCNHLSNSSSSSSSPRASEKRDESAELRQSIQQRLAEIRALSITADDHQLS